MLHFFLAIRPICVEIALYLMSNLTNTQSRIQVSMVKEYSSFCKIFISFSKHFPHSIQQTVYPKMSLHDVSRANGYYNCNTARWKTTRAPINPYISLFFYAFS